MKVSPATNQLIFVRHRRAFELNANARGWALLELTNALARLESNWQTLAIRRLDSKETVVMRR